jgi:hypothetical protein
MSSLVNCQVVNIVGFCEIDAVDDIEDDGQRYYPFIVTMQLVYI